MSDGPALPCGDGAALDALYRRHSAAALLAARAVSGNDADGEDARSDPFAGVFEDLLASGSPITSPSPKA